jgi:hypothetical protein
MKKKPQRQRQHHRPRAAVKRLLHPRRQAHHHPTRSRSGRGGKIKGFPPRAAPAEAQGIDLSTLPDQAPRPHRPRRPRRWRGGGSSTRAGGG